MVAKRERKGGGIKCEIGIDIYTLLWNRASLVAQMVKNQPAMQETWVQSLDREDTLEKGMGLPTPAFLPGEFREQRNLTSYSPWGRKESDTTERLTVSLSVFQS